MQSGRPISTLQVGCTPEDAGFSGGPQGAETDLTWCAEGRLCAAGHKTPWVALPLFFIIT